MATFKRGFKSWCEDLASELRLELGLKPADPIDPWKVARHFRIGLLTPEEIEGLEEKYLDVLLKEDPDSWSAVTLNINSTCVIIRNPTHSLARQASDLCHELAHILLSHRGARVDIGPDGHLLVNTYDKLQEREAGWLGGCLILPRPALVRIRKRCMTPAQVRHVYRASKQMLDYRMNVTGVERQFRYDKKSAK